MGRHSHPPIAAATPAAMGEVVVGLPPQGGPYGPVSLLRLRVSLRGQAEHFLPRLCPRQPGVPRDSADMRAVYAAIQSPNGLPSGGRRTIERRRGLQYVPLARGDGPSFPDYLLVWRGPRRSLRAPLR